MIPFYHKLCRTCNGTAQPSAREKLRKIQLERNANKLKKQRLPFQHYYRDILPYAEKLKQEGWRVVPIGIVVPDIIAFKDGKVKAVEIENKLVPKKEKVEAYKDFSVLYDEVEWVTKQNNGHKWKRPYQIVGNFARVPVIRIEHHNYRRGRFRNFVYNLTVIY